MAGNGIEDLGSPFADSIEAASVILRQLGAAKSLAYIMSKADSFGDAHRQGFEDEVVWGVVRTGLHDIGTELVEPLNVVMYVGDNEAKGRMLSSIGQELLEDGDTVDRSKVILRKAARVFEDTYVQQEGMTIDARTKFLFDSYLKVADLQEEAGDREGARTTALAASPHILAAAAELQEIGRDGAQKVDSNILKAISHIGPRHREVVSDLFSKLCASSYKRGAVEVLNRQVVVNLISELRMDESLGVMISHDLRPEADVWEEALRVWLEGHEYEVTNFLDDIDTCMPRFYSNCLLWDVNNTAMTSLLFKARKDHILLDVYKRMWKEHHEIQPLRDFAAWCGMEGEMDRLKDMGARFGLGEAGYSQIFEAYERGRAQMSGQ